MEKPCELIVLGSSSPLGAGVEAAVGVGATRLGAGATGLITALAKGTGRTAEGALAFGAGALAEGRGAGVAGGVITGVGSGVAEAVALGVGK